MAERRKLRIGRYTLRARWERKWQDAWIGAYWTTDRSYEGWGAISGDVWICLAPCFPLHVWWMRVDQEASDG